MILVQPVVQVRGIGDLTEGDFVATPATGAAAGLYQRLDRVFRAAGDLARFPLLGSGARATARQIEESARIAAQDAQGVSPDVASLTRTASALERQVAQVRRETRTNVIMVSLGSSAALGVGLYALWHRKKKA